MDDYNEIRCIGITNEDLYKKIESYIQSEKELLKIHWDKGNLHQKSKCVYYPISSDYLNQQSVFIKLFGVSAKLVSFSGGIKGAKRHCIIVESLDGAQNTYYSFIKNELAMAFLSATNELDKSKEIKIDIPVLGESSWYNINIKDDAYVNECICKKNKKGETIEVVTYDTFADNQGPFVSDIVIKFSKVVRGTAYLRLVADLYRVDLYDKSSSAQVKMKLM